MAKKDYKSMSDIERREFSQSIFDDYHSDDPKKVEEAKLTLIETNEWLVKQLYYNYGFASYSPAIEYEDFYHEAVVQTLEMLKSFDPSKGLFTTFVTTYILSAFYDVVKNSKTNLSRHYTQLQQKVKRWLILNSIEAEDVDDAIIYQIIQDTKMSQRDVRCALSLMQIAFVKSIEEADLMFESSIGNPEQDTFKKLDNEALYDSLKHLTQLQVTVLAYRYGLGGVEEIKEYRILAEKLGLSVTTVKQIEHKAIMILRGVEGLRSNHHDIVEKVKLDSIKQSILPINTGKEMLDELEDIVFLPDDDDEF